MPRTHGFSARPKSRLYQVWSEMLNRCRNPRSKDYPRYGGRGCQVAARWYRFENFYADMGPRPEGHQIDRIDPKGPYCPENCRWVTPRENAINKRDGIRFPYQGELLTMTEIGRRIGIGKSTIHKRIRILGWSWEKAIRTPLRPVGKVG